ncbi:hypothetical protein HAX54_048748 [Datura stramonium]|uniref:Uncharacterized protein n=1 Tax=Datura stramonium TaxID=4076 RepID=A0ABS8RQY7_DATST|nr:hypothetical protein [Datura stramonium]
MSDQVFIIFGHIAFINRLCPSYKVNSVMSAVFWFSIAANVKSIAFLIDFESDVENACSLMLLFQILNIRMLFASVLHFLSPDKIYH